LNTSKRSHETAVGLKDFEFLKPLGQGAYGGVFLVKKKKSGDLYAMKLIDCSQMVCSHSFYRKKLDTFIENLNAERNIFEILSGDFVVKGYYSFSHEHYFCFV
jgi:serine/threonine protein kinase